MDAIKTILKEAGYKTVEDVPIDEYAEISLKHYDDLIIEKIAPNRLSVSHTYTQRGDIMRDPEIVFKIDNGDWIAVMYQQDSTGTYQEDESGIESATTFAHNLWNDNIKNQGYIKAAKEQESIFN